MRHYCQKTQHTVLENPPNGIQRSRAELYFLNIESVLETLGEILFLPPEKKEDLNEPHKGDFQTL